MQHSILVLCTGNSCRSQMAEGFLKSLDRELRVYSAGTDPSETVHPLAVEVMREVGVDIGNNRPKRVDGFLGEPFDYVITVCDDARESCPFFAGRVRHRLHMGFEDPAMAEGSLDERLAVFRCTRDAIVLRFRAFYAMLEREE